jgi:mRNA-degrading endonuclease RelE of RelBE toxin-antitoxin system
MKRYQARYTVEAAGKIRKLHPQIKREIREGIRTLLETPLAGHPLHFELSGLRSYKVRYHRVIYRINADESMIDIVFVGPRRDVYEQLRDLLLGAQSMPRVVKKFRRSIIVRA